MSTSHTIIDGHIMSTSHTIIDGHIMSTSHTIIDGHVMSTSHTIIDGHIMSTSNTLSYMATWVPHTLLCKVTQDTWPTFALPHIWPTLSPFPTFDQPSPPSPHLTCPSPHFAFISCPSHNWSHPPTFPSTSPCEVNNYIVRSFKDVIIVTNTAARRTNKT